MNLSQAHHRDRLGVDEVGEHRARADRRQLIHVADEDDARPRRHRLEQFVHQHHVDHRRFVHDEQVHVERVFGVLLELPLLRVELQQAVDGLGLAAGGLVEPLGGAPGRRGEQDAKVLCQKHLDDRADDRGLAGTGAAGHHHQLVRDRGLDRGLLARGERDAHLLLGPRDCGIDVHGRERVRPGRERLHRPRHAQFREEQRLEEDEVLFGARRFPAARRGDAVAHDFVGDAQLFDRVDDAVRLDTGELFCLLAEQLLGVADVPVARFFLQNVPDGRLRGTASRAGCPG